MSRIDEALRRIGTVFPPGTSEPETPTLDPSVLERYHSEGGPPEPGQRAATPPLRTAVAASVPPTVTHRPKVLPVVGTERKADGKLITLGHTPPLLTEQYRRLAATLHDLQVERGLKTLVVTSALPHEGKTLTAANLALTLSESYGRRVLLIDGDLRQPSLHKVLGVPKAAGLSESIQSASRSGQFIELSSTLTLMPGGQPNPSPLAALSSDRMRSLLEDFATRFDWVVLDTPPVGLLPDGLILTRLTGACILVIRAGSTPFAAVDRAVSELGRECIIGTVLNGVEEGSIPSSKYDDYE